MNRVSIGSDDGLSPIRCQAIIYTNAGLLSIEPLGTNFSEILIKTQTFHSQKCIWKYRLQNGSHFVQGEMSWYHNTALTFERLLGSSEVETLVQFQSDWHPDLRPPRLHKIGGKMSICLVNKLPSVIKICTKWELSSTSHSLYTEGTSHRRPTLLTWINFNPAWINNYIHYKVWDEITYLVPNSNGCTHWSLRMDRWLHPMLYWASNYLSMLGFKLIHFSKRGPGCLKHRFHQHTQEAER